MSSRTWVTVTPLTHAVEGRGDVLRRHAERARLVLQHVDLDHARRLAPVEGHGRRDADSWRRYCRAPAANSRTLLMSGPLTRYCTGRPTGGPMSSRCTKASVPGKVLRSQVSIFLPAAGRAPRCSLVTITIWPKGDIGGLHVEGQHETHGALADIARPVIDILVAGEHFALESRHLGVGVAGSRRSAAGSSR